ncbi:MAG: glycine zipper domain-containing protein, partial [Thermoanaerobaculales bacterium]
HGFAGLYNARDRRQIASREVFLSRIARTMLVVVVVVLTVALGSAQEDQTKKEKRKGRRKGATGGAIVGLALGALTGDASLAVKGAAAGAVVGGVSGSWYDYDQSRQDDRTLMMADAIAGSKSGDVAAGETVGDVGKRHFEDLAGEWKLDIWYVGEGGLRKTAVGSARGLAAGDNAMRVLYQDITTEGYDGAVSGYSLLRYDPGQGFFMENSFSVSEDVLEFVGEFLVDKSAYNFYLTNITDGEMVAGGILRSSIRVEIRAVSPSLWVAETFTLIDGREEKVQSYRFTRP